ncbi:MAG: hypothetical protein ACPLTR_08525 [Thermacetogeniaceae bacterium]
MVKKSLVLVTALVFCLLATFAAPAAYAERASNTSNVVLYSADDLELSTYPIGTLRVNIDFDKALADRIGYDGVILELPLYLDYKSETLFVRLPNRLGGGCGGEALGPTPYVIAYGSYDPTHNFIKVTDLLMKAYYDPAVPLIAHLDNTVFPFGTGQ